MKPLEKYTFGVGDRFAHQAAAQLHAFEKLADEGVEVIPVWNKSNREHSFVGSEPQSVYDAAATAVAERNWSKPWHVDADHVGLKTVDRFIASSDFFTIDVADFIGLPAQGNEAAEFASRHGELVGRLDIEGLSEPLEITADDVRRVADNYLLATQAAGEVYRYIAGKKGADETIAEVSMDETANPQTPRELLIILAALADQKIPLQTIAPKFTGRFNKGVDYVGDLQQFEREFRDDVAVLRYAAQRYGLPDSLKLSVHSGSDKFSLYPIIRQAMADTDCGLHLKTAGTTWLEEVIGLSEAGGDGLALAKEIYAYALEHVQEFCAPYASVIDIDEKQLPSAAEVQSWSGSRLASAIRHVPGNKDFNPHLRQLLHVSFKVAAKHGRRYTDLLESNRDIVAHHVTENIYARHLRPLFIG